MWIQTWAMSEDLAGLGVARRGSSRRPGYLRAALVMGSSAQKVTLGARVMSSKACKLGWHNEGAAQKLQACKCLSKALLWERVRPMASTQRPTASGPVDGAT